MNFGIVLIFCALLASPSPSPAPAGRQAADPCLSEGHTSLLAALNRPTLGFSACAVKPRDIVAEMGYQNASGGAAQVQVPQGFLRAGITPGIEADLIGPAFLRNRAPGAKWGSADSGLGMKWEFAHDAAGASAVDVLYTAPTGSPAYTAGVPILTVNVDYSLALSRQFGVGATIGQSRAAFSSTTPSMVLTDQFNARAQIYAEAFAQSRTRPDGGALGGLDAGLQLLLGAQFEVDIEAGRTITDRVRTKYVGAGVGARL